MRQSFKQLYRSTPACYWYFILCGITHYLSLPYPCGLFLSCSGSQPAEYRWVQLYSITLGMYRLVIGLHISNWRDDPAILKTKYLALYGSNDSFIHIYPWQFLLDSWQPPQADLLKRNTSTSVVRWTSHRGYLHLITRGPWSCPLLNTMASPCHPCNCPLNPTDPHLSPDTLTCPSHLQVRAHASFAFCQLVCVFGVSCIFRPLLFVCCVFSIRLLGYVWVWIQKY